VVARDDEPRDDEPRAPPLAHGATASAVLSVKLSPELPACFATAELMPRRRHPQLSRRSLRPKLQSFFVPLTTRSRSRRCCCGSCWFWFWCWCCPEMPFAIHYHRQVTDGEPQLQRPGLEDGAPGCQACWRTRRWRARLSTANRPDKLSVARRLPNGQDHGQVHDRRRSHLQLARRLPGPEFGHFVTFVRILKAHVLKTHLRPRLCRAGDQHLFAAKGQYNASVRAMTIIADDGAIIRWLVGRPVPY